MDEKNTGTTVTETITAENSGGDPKGNADNAAAVSTNEGAEKTFTQAELDDAIKRRLERERKGMPSKDELKAFHEWQDSQKTAEQLSAEKLTAAENGRADAVRRAEAAEAKCTAFSKGVKPDSVDDVIALAMSKVSDSVTIEQAIDEVIGKYPTFCGTDKPKAPQGADMSGGGRNITDGVTARFLERNPSIKL